MTVIYRNVHLAAKWMFFIHHAQETVHSAQRRQLTRIVHKELEKYYNTP